MKLVGLQTQARLLYTTLSVEAIHSEAWMNVSRIEDFCLGEFAPVMGSNSNVEFSNTVVDAYSMALCTVL